MVREYGRAPRGERLVASVPHGHRKTSTFIGCLHEGGMVAPYVLDGAVNGELFVAYIEQQVVPSLARGDVLIMDNLPVHKAAGVRHALEAAGITLLFLPAYSSHPDGRCAVAGSRQDFAIPDPRGMRQLLPALWLWPVRLKTL